MPTEDNQPTPQPIIDHREADYWTRCPKCGNRIQRLDIMHANLCPMKDSLDNILDK